MTKYLFPKIDLHLHLDGSFRVSTMYELAKERGIELPGKDQQGYRDFLNEKANAKDVNEYLEMFDIPLQVMQDYNSLYRITEELIEDIAQAKVSYAEIRFAPQLHTKKQLTQEAALKAVLDGRNAGLKNNPSIHVNIITCMMCIGLDTLNRKENEETLEICKKYFGNDGVVALDLAGAEGIVPLKNYAPLFLKAKEYGINTICHAGDSQDWQTVKDAIDFKVSRIGHGHMIYENPALVRLAAKKQIALEICPTSNIQCKTRQSYALHPAKNLLQMGIPVTINTDNITLAKVNLDDEYDHCLNEMGFEMKDLIQMNLNAIKFSFAKQEVKDKLIKELETFL